MIPSSVKRVFSFVMLALSLLLLAGGISGLTWLRPGPYMVATSQPTPPGVVMTGENVLESTGESVDITVRAPKSAKVFLAVGLTSDVEAFAQTIDHQRLKAFTPGGFESEVVKGKTVSAHSEQTAKGLQPPAAPKQSTQPDPTNLDIWKHSATGTGKVTLRWALSDNRWSAVAFTLPFAKSPAKQAAPTLELRWIHQPSLAPTWALTIVGILASVAVGTYLFLSWISQRRTNARRQDAAEEENTRQLAAEATGDVELNARPTRRSLRMAAQRSARATEETATKNESAAEESAAGETAETPSETEENLHA